MGRVEHGSKASKGTEGSGGLGWMKGKSGEAQLVLDLYVEKWDSR